MPVTFTVPELETLIELPAVRVPSEAKVRAPETEVTVPAPAVPVSAPTVSVLAPPV